jgi:hypothetical protein
MMTNNHGGKGSSPRPISNKKQFDKNWNLIFGEKKDNENTKCKSKRKKISAVGS